MADVIIKHISSDSDSVRQDTINSGDYITFKAEGATFNITFDNPNSFIPPKAGISVSPQSPQKLTPANDITSILFNYKCSLCNNPLGRPARIIIGGVKIINDQLDRIEYKLYVLLSKVENIEQKLNKFLK